MGCRSSRLSAIEPGAPPPDGDAQEDGPRFVTQLEYDLAFVSPPGHGEHHDASLGRAGERLKGDASANGASRGASDTSVFTPLRRPASIFAVPLAALSTLTWSAASMWLAEQLALMLGWLRTQWRWLLRCESQQRRVVASFVCVTVCLFALVLVVLISQSRAWAFLPGRGGVTLFYELLMCPQTSLVTHRGRRFLHQVAQTNAACPGGLSARQEAAAQSRRAPSLDVSLRLEDGYALGRPYLPVVLLGRGEYALVSFSAVDALRRPVYVPVTLQLGPDERYPWETNASEPVAAEENVFEDVVEDLGEDLLEVLVEATSDVVEELSDETSDLVETISEDLFDSIDGRNATQDKAEELAEVAEEVAEEAAEKAEEVAEEAAEEAAEEEEEEFEAAEEQGLLLGAAQRGTYYNMKRSRVGKAALCALRVDDDCDYFLHDRMSPHVSVPEAYYDAASPPYFFGARAVPSGSPILVATSEYYSVRTNSKERRICEGASCANVSVYRPQEDADRYELVPAAALLTPESRVRWPLQLRIETVDVYAELPADAAGSTRGAPAPLLITFQKLGFEPQFAAFSARDRAADHILKYHGRSTPRGLVLLLALALLLGLVLLCGHTARAVIGEDERLTWGRDSPDSQLNGSPSISRASSPELVVASRQVSRPQLPATTELV